MFFTIPRAVMLAALLFGCAPERPNSPSVQTVAFMRPAPMMPGLSSEELPAPLNPPAPGRRVEVSESPGVLERIDAPPMVEVGDVFIFQVIANHLSATRQQMYLQNYTVVEVRSDGTIALELPGGLRHTRSRAGNFIEGYTWRGVLARVAPERDVIPTFPIVVGQTKNLRPFGFMSISRFVHMTPTMEAPTAQTLVIAGQPFETIRLRVSMVEPNGLRHIESTWISPVVGRIQTEYISMSEPVQYIETLVQHCRRGVCNPISPVS